MLPQYSGGLGILAGDHLKAASDLGVPIIGVGLLYGSGYFRQSLSRDGWQLERYPSLDPQGLPHHARCETPTGNPVRVSLALPGVAHAARPGLGGPGRPGAAAAARQRHRGERRRRAAGHRPALRRRRRSTGCEQELLLGVGGVRAIRAYCAATGTPAPEVFHTNEGHAGFLGVERIRELVEADALSFDEALQAVRAGTVFTTHTPVPAGIDRFARDLVAAHLGGIAGRCRPSGSSPSAPRRTRRSSTWRTWGCGSASAPTACRVLHGEVSREMFADLWPGFDADEVPITSVTNGVHAPTWMSREILDIAEREVGAGGRWPRAAAGTRSTRSPTPSCGSVRDMLRARLVDEIRRRIRASALQRGMTEAELGWTATAFDPDVLTIGFARRVPSYKRLTLMLRDPERLQRAAARSRAAGADRDRRQEPPGRRRRQAADRADGAVRRRPGGAAPDHVPARLRHRAWPATSTGASTSG